MDLPVTPLSEWGLPIGNTFLGAGPCSAETEDQLLATARGLKDCGLGFFRAGMWKPRTHPGAFEGVGVEGFEWLVRVKEEYGLPVGVEVATPEHVEACLEHNIDVVWIGARTTPNPFAVQSLADAMKGTDMRVFVKNPISPDLELWIGALERFHGAGLRKIGVIHRGFSTSKKVLYRFAPHWKIPIEFKRRLPGVPILCDPSHICGKSDLIFSIAQEALDLLYDGLMIEVHVDPANALSDSKQQLTPEQFHVLIERLTVKSELIQCEEYQARIKELRFEVDSLDKQLIEVLGKRMEIVREMGDLKRKNGISTLQPGRWNEIVASRAVSGSELGLAAEFVFELFESIHEEAIRQQEVGND
ncbi:MAG: bifunctional 3-deoxy-7-phosphoheptulonate synthase/chorismate mutase type II [Kiritimatiellia bacterium]|jgi:chorismate mutase|nr:bifunctional 3-deoxy-7-phosphoheptulonate synthase/chorismate mutase type II [Kiritimatiellia bacterium]